MENKKSMNMIVAVVICLALVGVLIFISIHNKVNSTNSTTNDMTNNTPTDENIGAAPGQTTEVAKAGDTITVNYTGRLVNGTVFDSNVDPKFQHVQPFVFTLGAGQVIPGWDKGIVGMKVGEKKTLTIPPEDGYGATGQGPIPPNSTLIFDVELLKIN